MTWKLVKMAYYEIKKAYYGIRDGQKGPLGLGKWSKMLIMMSKMVKKENQDIRDGKTGKL